MAAMGARVWIHTLPVNALASQTVPAALRMSSAAVSTPAMGPAARMALVPPVRPLATLRISLPVISLTMIRPNGMAPMK
jgi:hypothetical protein